MRYTMLFTILFEFNRLKLWTIVGLNGDWQPMSTESVCQAVDDLFSSSGLHDLDLIESAIVIDNHQQGVPGWKWSHQVDG